MDNLTFPFHSPYPISQITTSLVTVSISPSWSPREGLSGLSALTLFPNSVLPTLPRTVYSAKGSHQIARPLSRTAYFLKEKSIANNHDSHGLKGCSPKISDHLLQLSVFALFFLSTMPTTVPLGTLVCSQLRNTPPAVASAYRVVSPVYLQSLLLSQCSSFYLNSSLGEAYPSYVHLK